MNDEAVILAVDDQAQNIRLLDAVLSPRGYRVLTAESGEAALDLLRKEQPHVVLLDIMMPGMDGYEVCRRIRENPDYRLPTRRDDHCERYPAEGQGDRSRSR